MVNGGRVGHRGDPERPWPRLSAPQRLPLRWRGGFAWWRSGFPSPVSEEQDQPNHDGQPDDGPEQGLDLLVRPRSVRRRWGTDTVEDRKRDRNRDRRAAQVDGPGALARGIVGHGPESEPVGSVRLGKLEIGSGASVGRAIQCDGPRSPGRWTGLTGSNRMTHLTPWSGQSGPLRGWCDLLLVQHAFCGVNRRRR
jgi:hypothetical protein